MELAVDACSVAVGSSAHRILKKPPLTSYSPTIIITTFTNYPTSRNFISLIQNG